MGCIQKRPSELGEVLDYRQTASVVIKRRDSIGRVVGGDQVHFRFTVPKETEVYTANLGGGSLVMSTCVLPGQNPRGTPEKVCQDALFVESTDSSVLVGLFDGHGTEGEKVASFCVDFARNYYREHVFEFSHDPSMNMTLLCELCDRKLKDSGEISCDRSGTTAVLAYFNETGLCIGSVGDSRAVLAYLPHKTHEEFTLSGETEKPVKRKESNPYRREIVPSRVLDFTQTTVDQKPESKEELSRIIKAGGCVEKAKDGRGVRVGPYRVWKRGANYPGLAMSRSIGDKSGEQCGIIPTPVVSTFRVHPGADQFLVVASDGVWDVLDNRDAINFIERYRRSAQRVCNTKVTKANPRATNTTIAHLVCEEARLRWLGIVEDEGVMIDDISCVVVEMNSGGPELGRGPDLIAGAVPRMEGVEEEKEELNVDDLSAQATETMVRNDAKRGSMVAPTQLKDLLEEI